MDLSEEEALETSGGKAFQEKKNSKCKGPEAQVLAKQQGALVRWGSTKQGRCYEGVVLEVLVGL